MNTVIRKDNAFRHSMSGDFVFTVYSSILHAGEYFSISGNRDAGTEMFLLYCQRK